MKGSSYPPKSKGYPGSYKSGGQKDRYDEGGERRRSPYERHEKVLRIPAVNSPRLERGVPQKEEQIEGLSK